MLTYELKIADERLDMARCLSSGQVFRWQKVDQFWIGVDGRAWFRVLETAPGNLRVETNADRRAFERLFRLDLDANEVEALILGKGPELAPYAEQLRGLRLLRPSVPEEVFFSFLCSANNHISRIGQMIRKLAAYGDSLGEVDGLMLHVFPTPNRIAEIPEAELRAKGFGYRGASIPEAARQLTDRGEGWLTALSKQPYQEIKRELVAIKSIGPKLADCIAIFGLGRTDVVPIDTHIWQAMTRLYYPQWEGKPLTDLKYREASDFFRNRFGEHTGWAHQYLFYDSVLHWRGRKK